MKQSVPSPTKLNDNTYAPPMSGPLLPEEEHLLGILTDRSGIDLMQFIGVDETRPDRCMRARSYQYHWFRSYTLYEADHCGRDIGKALALDTPIPTPMGWTVMGDLVAGDLIYGADGSPVTVTHAHPVQEGRPCYEVEFDDGEVIVADAEHLWSATSKRGRRARSGPEVVTTQGMADSLMAGKEGNWQIRVAGIQGNPERDLPMDPYVLGYWLGNGASAQAHVTIGRDDAEFVVAEFARRGYSLTQLPSNPLTWAVGECPRTGDQLTTVLARMKVLGVKHIPGEYLRASPRQRMDLLRGLCDSDGSVEPKWGRCENTQKSEALFHGLVELLHTLGQKAFHREVKRGKIDGRTVGFYCRVNWVPRLGVNPFLMPRKASRVRPEDPCGRRDSRRVVGIRRVASVPVRCIEVSSDDRLFLAGRGMVPTHNSFGSIARAIAWPFCFPGQDIMYTAPELNHLRPLTDGIEKFLLGYRLLREMLPGAGRQKRAITRVPAFTVTFANNARIITRLPGKTGRGVKGIHATAIEVDECFPAGTMVLTRRGQVAIEQVVVGDEVFTHQNRWRKVTKLFDRGERDAISLRGHGNPGLVVTPDHKFWARPVERYKDAKNQWGPIFGDPAWVSASGLPKRALWGSPVSIAGVVAPAEVPRPRTGRNQAIAIDLNFMEVLGWYLAEGSTQPGGKVNFSVHVDEAAGVQELLARSGIHSWVGKVLASDKCVNVVAQNRELARFLDEHCSKVARSKRVPVWVHSLSQEMKHALLAGLIAGDGFFDPDSRYEPGRWKLTTASRAMAVDVRLLGLSLGLHMTLFHSGPRKSQIRGREVSSGDWYQVVANSKGQARFEGDGAWGMVEGAAPAGTHRMFDLEVDEDHSFLADGIYVHNSQDFPEAGFTEMIESMRSALPGAQMKLHGVSNGDNGRFDRILTSPDPNLPFKTHRFIAMDRPDWTDAERRAKIAQYGGSEDGVDYGRNLFGNAGSTNTALLSRRRLMACVRIQESAWAIQYNRDLYRRVKISEEHLRDGRDALVEVFGQLPEGMLSDEYVAYYGGMDVGFVRDPTEILIFGLRVDSDGDESIRLLLRIHLARITGVDQAYVVRSIFDHFGERLLSFGMDRTGAGLPVYQTLVDPYSDDAMSERERARVIGYAAQEKVPVGLDDRELLPHETEDDLLIYKSVTEWGFDAVRAVVDSRGIELPFDNELLAELQGEIAMETAKQRAGAVRKRSGHKISLHTLDALLLMLAAKDLPEIAKMLFPPQEDVLEPLWD